MPSLSNQSPGLYALLIAVDHYRPGSIEGITYPSLMGCVRDANLVEAFLRRRLRVSEDRIVRLTSTNPPPGRAGPIEPPERQPTYENMVLAFRRVTAAARAGDQLYIHYSGHGGRTRTIWPDLKPDGLDESLVPLDIHDPAARYLRDLEVAQLLQEMVDKGLFVTLVLDSCHSGGATRGIGQGAQGLAVRGIDSIDGTPRPTDGLVAPANVLADTWRWQARHAARNLAAHCGWVPPPNEYVLLAACRSHEFAYEYAFNGTDRNGALTYWLLDALRALRPGMTYQALYDRVLAKVHSQFDRQSPVLQGPADRAVLGSDSLPLQPTFLVMGVDPADGRRVRMQTGQAVGVCRGARFALYPQGSDVADLESRTAIAEVTELGASDSWAKVVELRGTGKIQAGDAAVLLGASRLRRKVRLVSRPDLPGGSTEGSWEAVRESLQGNGWVEEGGEGDEVDFHVSVARNDEQLVYVIGDPANLPLSNLQPPILVDEGAAAALVRRLEHLARYYAIKEIENHDEDSPLAGRLVVEMLGRQRDYDPGDLPRPESFPPGGDPELEVGEWTFVRVRNTTADIVLNTAALDLQPDWGISLVFPGKGDASFEAIEPGRERVIKLRANLPPGYQAGTDILKVFATVGTADFRALTVPALDRPPRHRSAEERGQSRGGRPPSQLDQLLYALTAERPTRTLTPGAIASEEWTVVQIEVRVRGPGGVAASECT